MPLDDTYPLSVVFIVGQRSDRDGIVKSVPIGTGFLVGVPVEDVPGQVFVYVVTAWHIVRALDSTWVRFNRKDGGVSDEPVRQWTEHPTADVAVSRVTNLADFRLKHVLVDNFAKRDVEAFLGDHVYFIGLLANATKMSAANIPMVRGGTLGRLYQPEVPLKNADDSVSILPVAHLIDCRSYAGFSGSPCFVQFDKPRSIGTKLMMEHETVLLGLISGHFDDWVKTKTTGDILGEVQSRINTGVGVVTPAEMILEALETEELVDERAERSAAIREELEDDEDHRAATADSVDNAEPFDEFARFEDMTRRLLQVPKKELDDKLRES